MLALAGPGQAALDAARPKVEAADKRIMALLPKAKRDGFLGLLAELAGEADAAPAKARAEARAAKKAAREAKKLAKKAARPAKVKAEKPATGTMRRNSARCLPAGRPRIDSTTRSTRSPCGQPPDLGAVPPGGGGPLGLAVDVLSGRVILSNARVHAVSPNVAP